MAKNKKRPFDQPGKPMPRRIYEIRRVVSPGDPGPDNPNSDNFRFRPPIYTDQPPPSLPKTPRPKSPPQEALGSAWIQTFTGRYFHPLTPQESSVAIEDIAHSLALKARFGGHTKRFYSIAEHSWRVAMLLKDQGAPPEGQLWGLMHECPLAYLPDVPEAYKEDVQITTMPWPEDYEGTVWIERTFDEIEERLASVICTALGVSIAHKDAVDHAGDVLLATEARDLFSTTPPEDWTDGLPEPLTEKIESTMGWELAEERFLSAYRDLCLGWDL